MDPLERHCRWQLDWGYEIVDKLGELERILKLYEGTHDFCCFAGALEANARKTGKPMGTVRTIHTVNLIKETKNDDDMIPPQSTSTWGSDEEKSD